MTSVCSATISTRVVKNVFGILSQCWRVYQCRLQVAPETADSIMKATWILHNFLRRANGDHSAEPDSSDGAEGSELGDNRGLRGNRASAEALRVRDTFRRYFNSPAGQVPWQVPHMNRGLPQWHDWFILNMENYYIKWIHNDKHTVACFVKWRLKALCLQSCI